MENSNNSQDDLIPDTPYSEDYGLTRMNYIYNEIQAFYPQISNGLDEEKRNAINKIIQQDLGEIINIYADTVESSVEIGESEMHEFALTVDYDIKLKNSDYLSIYYLAGSSRAAAYPSETVYTTNIDIKKMKKIQLKDMITLDKDFAEYLKGWDVKISEENNKDLKKATEDYINNLDITTLYDGLLNADKIGIKNTLGVYSYLTEDTLGINLSVPHVLGDNIQFESKFDKLKDYLKKEFK
jgi:hypothetical protein